MEDKNQKDRPLQGSAEYWPVEDKLEMHLYDLVNGDLANIEIKKSSNGNCLIQDTTKYYKGFILNITPDTQTICELVFYPSKTSGLFTPRPTFYKITNSTHEVKETTKTKVRISFNDSSEGLDQFWKMIGFLEKFKDIVFLGDFTGKYKVVGTDDIVLQLKDLPEKERILKIIEYALKSNVEASTLAETALHLERKAVLQIFKNLLNEVGYIEKYKTLNEIKMKGEEAAWHHFLKNNEWLLGLNLDIRFIQDFIDEASIGNPNTLNKGNMKVDLLGLSDYTVLVELKTANTLFFSEKRNSNSRTATWSFGNEFIEGFSQCLAQKFDFDKEADSKDIVLNNELIDKREYRTVDPKTIYIVGNKSKEIPKGSANVDIHTKRDTLERFKRNNRNIEIISYDELFERATYIVEGNKKKDLVKDSMEELVF